MHPQLVEITKVLEDAGIRYWVDSGTLIGLMREGDVLHYDKDIDLGIWAEDEPQTLALASRFEEAGYTIEQGKYKDLGYNIKLRPRKGGMLASIGVYRRHEERAWRMALFTTDNPHASGSARFYLRGAWRFPLRYATLGARKLVGRDRLLGRWPWSHVIRAGVWVVPARHFEHINTHDSGLPIPAEAESYLTYRYGDWSSPVKDWVWYRDDRAVHHELPERLFGAVGEPLMSRQTAPSA
jgi:hypothetical protein